MPDASSGPELPYLANLSLSYGEALGPLTKAVDAWDEYADWNPVPPLAHQARDLIDAARALVAANRELEAYVAHLRTQTIDAYLRTQTDAATARAVLGLPKVDPAWGDPQRAQASVGYTMPQVPPATMKACIEVPYTEDMVRDEAVVNRVYGYAEGGPSRQPCPNGCGLLLTPEYENHICPGAPPCDEHYTEGKVCATHRGKLSALAECWNFRDALGNAPERGCCASRIDAYHAADCQAPGVVREGEFDR